MVVHRMDAADRDQRADLGCNATAGIATKTSMSAAPRDPGLTPENHPWDAGQDELERQDADRREAERREAERIERLQRDLDIYSELVAEDFDGVAWNRFSTELARYGIAVARVWLRSGKMHWKCIEHYRGALRNKKFGLTPPPLGWDDTDRETIANETVTRALIFFRDKARGTGGWRASGGASLTTYFMGACLRAYPNVYNSWLKDHQKHATEMSTAAPMDPDAIANSSLRPDTVVLQRFRVADGFAQIPDDRTRRVVELKAAGYSYDEIAAKLTEERLTDPANPRRPVTPRAAHGLWQRHVRRMHPLSEQAERAGELHQQGHSDHVIAELLTQEAMTSGTPPERATVTASEAHALIERYRSRPPRLHGSDND